MVVKDIGVFPCWMSFPYRPEHIKMLTINLRIVRPGTSIVPNEWVEVARHDEELYSRWENSPAQWNVVIMAVLLYAFGRFSVKPDPAQPLINRSNQPTVAGEAVFTKKQAVRNAKKKDTLPPTLKAKKSKFGMRPNLPNLADHQSDTFNAHTLPSPSYVVDKLFIDFKDCEYDANNKPVPPGDPDSCKKSRFYKEGCVQFGREVFQDFSAQDFSGQYKDYEEIQDEEGLISQGKFACYQLQDRLTNFFWGRLSPGVRQSAYGPYLNMLARSVGEVWYSGCRESPTWLLERHPSGWIDVMYVLDAQLDPEGYSKATIERDMAREMASASPNEELIDDFRLLQIRRSHGWVREDD